MSHVITVEFLIDGAWVDICGPGDVLGRDQIRITRGRADWTSRSTASRALFSVKNKEGHYSPRNPHSPYFGKIGRNTTMRITVDGDVRFLGELAEWPQRADPDVHIPMVAEGALRRLSQNDERLRSVMYRTLLQRGVLPTPQAYWPAEDGSQSTAIWSALPRHRPMTIYDGISLAGFSDIDASDPIPVLNDTQFYGNVPTYSSTTTVTGLCLVRFTPDTLPGNGLSFMVLNGTGTGSYWRVQVNINYTVRLQIADEDGTVISTSSDTSFSVDPRGAIVALRLTQSGANVNWSIRCYQYGGTGVQALGGTATSRTFGRIDRITIGASNSLGATAVGHIALYKQAISDLTLQGAINAYVGEKAGRRVERLCLEEGVPLAVVGDLDDTQPVGPQRPKKFLDLLEESAAADGGVLYEPTHVSTMLGTFETGTRQGWTGAGTAPPTLSFSSVRAHSGGGSLRITWAGGASDQIAHVAQPNQFVPGTVYTATAWVWVPAGATAVSLVVGGVGFGPSSTLTNQWQKLTYTFTATATDNEVQIWAVTPAGVGAQAWIDDVEVSTNKPGLAYRTRKSLYNVLTSLTLDFEQNHVALPFEPTDDDQLLRQLGNSVTVTREDGGSTTFEVTTGPLSVNDPPDGVGRYRGGGTYNLFNDADTRLVASWLAYLATWDEQRYPRLGVNLHRHPSLAADAAGVDVGDRITINSPPSWLPPEVIEQQVQGYEETLDARMWRLDFTCTPWRPFRVATVGDARLDTTRSLLAFDHTTGHTTMTVQIQSGGAPWIQSAQKPTLFPFAILVGGEEMSVTASNAPVGAIQTLTVVRAVNGVLKAHPLGTQVRVKNKAYVPW